MFSRIPDPKFFPSRIPDQKDSGSPRIRIKEFKYFNPENCFKALGNMIRVVHPRSGSGSWFLPIPDPGGQEETGSRIRTSLSLKIKFSYLDGLLVESVQIGPEALQLFAELSRGPLQVGLLRLNNGVLRLQGQQLKNKELWSDSIRSVDPDPGGQKLPTKIGEKNKKFHVSKCFFFNVLFCGLKASPVAWTSLMEA